MALLAGRPQKFHPWKSIWKTAFARIKTSERIDAAIVQQETDAKRAVDALKKLDEDN